MLCGGAAIVGMTASAQAATNAAIRFRSPPIPYLRSAALLLCQYIRLKCSRCVNQMSHTLDRNASAISTL